MRNCTVTAPKISAPSPPVQKNYRYQKFMKDQLYPQLFLV